MNAPKRERTITFEKVGDVWHATMQTPDGPITAIGASLREARVSLEAMIRTWEASAASGTSTPKSPRR